MEKTEVKEVELIASGYEWTCPECEELKTEIEIKETVECKECGKQFSVADYYHCFG
jgi:uncharacterized protein (DUF983 family)